MKGGVYYVESFSEFGFGMGCLGHLITDDPAP